MKELHTYTIEVTGDANVEYFRDYINYEFLAHNDKEAIAKVEEIQEICENKMREAGVELTEYDPCLVNHIYRITEDDRVRVVF